MNTKKKKSILSENSTFLPIYSQMFNEISQIINKKTCKWMGVCRTSISAFEIMWSFTQLSA